MIIVRMQGGLGNQLFQYALYENFKSKGITTKIDISTYIDGREARPLELDKLGLHFETADKKELHAYFADDDIFFDRLLRYSIGIKKYIKDTKFDFDSRILNLTEGFLNGYWQSDKYFAPIGSVIREQICFQNIDTDAIKDREKRMRESDSVSIHVRMGDYLQCSDLYGNICTKEYYRKAIRYISEKIENPVFYIFSDEPAKAAEMLSGYSFDMVTENKGADSYKDMYLMSCCKHHIIANSSFSWWGAWLDQKPGKIVVTPSRWNQLCKQHDICCDGWVMM